MRIKLWFSKVKDSLFSWCFVHISPWYIRKLMEDINYLPHETTCHSLIGPYKCNCAKYRLKRTLRWMEEK